MRMPHLRANFSVPGSTSCPKVLLGMSTGRNFVRSGRADRSYGAPTLRYVMGFGRHTDSARRGPMEKILDGRLLQSGTAVSTG